MTTDERDEYADDWQFRAACRQRDEAEARLRAAEEALRRIATPGRGENVNWRARIARAALAGVQAPATLAEGVDERSESGSGNRLSSEGTAKAATPRQEPSRRAPAPSVSAGVQAPAQPYPPNNQFLGRGTNLTWGDVRRAGVQAPAGEDTP